MTSFTGLAVDLQGNIPDRDVARVVNNLLRGKTNNTGTVTLAANQTSTVVLNPLCGFDSAVSLTPLTANAAAAVANAFISNRDNGVGFTITHANNAQTDREFSYVITG